MTSVSCLRGDYIRFLEVEDAPLGVIQSNCYIAVDP